MVFDSFVAKNRTAYVRWAYTRLGSLEDSRDAVNEAFLRLYRRWNDALASASTDAYAWKILHDTVVDALRTRDRNPCSGGGLAFEPHVRPIAGIPDREIDQVPLRMELHKAISELSQQQQKCVTLHYLLGCPVTEVAHVTGLAVSTVHSHLSSARTALAKAMGEEGTVPDHEKGDH